MLAEPVDSSLHEPQMDEPRWTYQTHMTKTHMTNTIAPLQQGMLYKRVMSVCSHYLHGMQYKFHGLHYKNSNSS